MPDKPHRNHGLFSDHYLDELVPELEGGALQAALALQTALRDIYERNVPLVKDAHEAVCEEKLIRPVMRRLGFELDPQPPLETVESIFTPDYALFASAEELAEVAPSRGDEQYYRRAAAVGEAKRWDRHLGSAEPGEDEAARRQHPGAQIRRYLLDSGARWGILTNGRLWRIYEREASRAGLHYYEVDLPALLDADVQDFRYFFLFFRAAGFAPGPDGRSLVERTLDESRQYWLGLTDRLKDRVYDALTSLMTGMIHGSDHLGPEDIEQVHEAALIVLYRLLFAFYAEARRLLPVENETYRRDFAVTARREQVAARLDAGEDYPRAGTSLWTWCRNLSEIINAGDPESGVPEYDGGLFDPDQWPLLGDPRVRVPDREMARVIDSLGRDQDPDSGRRVNLDYHELSVRELGSIYEGLLELRPHWAPPGEPVIEVPGDRAPRIIPLADAGDDEREAERRRWEDEVYLQTDRGERKATGSYYTPEYIVDYIVTNTLDPLLTAAAARVAADRPAVEAQIAERERRIARWGDDHPESAKMRAVIEKLKLDLLEPYFELMVLDPAMGSGHFLVAASEEITEAIITDPSHLPPAEAADEDDENIFYKRRVVERCLYGVDLNPLAVELAKLSLWLHTVEFGKPLSFLKHHLRKGNSLIGARLGEMRRLPDAGERERSAQLNLFTQSFLPEATRLLQAFNLIERMPTDTLAQEREKEAAWREIEQRRERFRQVANVWLSTYFGNEVDDADYARAVDALTGPAAFDDLEREGWFADAQSLAAEHSFFHWELEFPDAFFTEQGPKREGERGFDAVVGNPPWGPLVIASEASAFCRASFAHPSDDAFALFLQKATRIARSGGHVGQILPSGWQTASASAGLREAVLGALAPNTVVNLPYDVFVDAYVDTMILLGAREERRPADSTRVRVLTYGRKDHVSCIEAGDQRWVTHDTGRWFSEDLPGAADLQMLTYMPPMAVEVAAKIGRLSEPLGEHADVQRGITPFNVTPARAAPKEPGLVGELRRYKLETETADVEYHGGIAEYKPQRYFTGSRLLLRELISRQFELQAAWTDADFVTNKSIQSIVAVDQYGLWYLLATLNSALLSYIHVQASAVALRDDFPKIVLAETRALPIRIIDFDHPTDEALKEEALGRCREAIEAGDYETPFVLARAALAAHAAAHGPAGKPELREDDYWAAEIAWFEERADDDERGAAEATRLQAAGQQRREAVPPPSPERRGGTEGGEVSDLREDFVHDLLASLAQRMIDLNARRHEEKQRFLGWLERRLGCAIDDLSGRTIIRDFDDRERVPDYAELSRRLCQAANRRKMDVDPRRAQIDNLVQEAYEEAMEDLDALNEALARTDALIDRIVYALYGLGEEEIAIIEGHGGNESNDGN